MHTFSCPPQATRAASRPANEAEVPSAYATLHRLEATLTHSPASSSTAPPTTQQYIDVRFSGAPVELHCLTFTNFYTGSLTVLHSMHAVGRKAEVAPRMRSAEDDAPAAAAGNWLVLVPRYRLMADPHCEDDAQAQHELGVADFAAPGRVVSLRLCLAQPSPLWRLHTLNSLRFYTLKPADPISLAPLQLSPPEADRVAILAEEVRLRIAHGRGAALLPHSHHLFLFTISEPHPHTYYQTTLRVYFRTTDRATEEPSSFLVYRWRRSSPPRCRCGRRSTRPSRPGSWIRSVCTRTSWASLMRRCAAWALMKRESRDPIGRGAPWPLQDIVLCRGFCTRINTIICKQPLCLSTPLTTSHRPHYCAINYTPPTPFIAVYVISHCAWQYRVKANPLLPLLTRLSVLPWFLRRCSSRERAAGERL